MEVDEVAVPPIAVSAPASLPPASANGGAATNADTDGSVIVVVNPVSWFKPIFYQS